MIVTPARAADLLARGGVVAYPTETVYGLGADPRSASGLAALLALKGRDPARGLSVLLPDADALERRVSDLPARAAALARRFWPGPLTLVVPHTDPELARVASERGVGFRCSPQPTAAALARRCLLVSTSCNHSGEPPCSDAREVEQAFGPELAIAGGEPAGGQAASTVVAVTADGRLEILRRGVLEIVEEPA